VLFSLTLFAIQLHLLSTLSTLFLSLAKLAAYSANSLLVNLPTTSSLTLGSNASTTKHASDNVRNAFGSFIKIVGCHNVAKSSNTAVFNPLASSSYFALNL
jgi:hypothetical protein